MYPDLSKPKDYEKFFLSQCATCSVRFDHGSPRATKLRMLRNEENSSDYEEITNIDVLSFVYGIPSSTLTSNLVANLHDFNTARESAERRANWLTNANLSDIDSSLSLALCQSCAPKLADLYGSHKAFVNNLAVDSFVSKATNVTPTSSNTRIHPQNVDTDFQASEKFTHTVKVENESLPSDEDTHFSDSEHLQDSPQPSHDPLLPDVENKINLMEKAPSSSGENNDNKSSNKVDSFPIISPMYCQECDLQFTSAYAISVHKIEIHDKQELVICRQKVKGPPFHCPMSPCDKKFTKQYSVKYHCLRKHRVKLLTTTDNEKHSFCNICRLSFANMTGLRLHQGKVHRTGIKKEVPQPVNVQATVKCHRCQSEYKSMEDLQKHGLESHVPKIILDRQTVTAGTKVRCLQCQLTYDDISELNTHSENQHQTKNATKKELTETPSDFNENSNDSANSFLNDDDFQESNNDEQLTVHSESVKGPPYKCPKCSSVYRRLEVLKGHCRKIHQLQLPFQRKFSLKLDITCTICSLRFDNMTGWKNHNRYSHKLLVVCDHCYKAFENAKLLKIHLKDDHPEKLFSDEMNSQKTVKIRSEVSELEKLKVKVVKNVPKIKKSKPSSKNGIVGDFYCKKCKRCWKSVHELKAHNQSCHNSWEKYFCIECNSEHESLDLLSDHSLNIHDKKINLDEKISCSECELTFTKVPELENHVEEVHKIFQCSNCLKNFSSNEFREIHYKRHSPDFPKNRCEFCEKDFLNIYTMQEHQQHQHFKEMMLPEIKEQCPLCDKTYKWKSHVNKHILRDHALEKPHKCEQCNKSFAKEYLLVSHIKREHEKEKKFKCPHCDMKFTYVTAFNLHVVKHSDARPFACNICEKGFKREFELKIHMKVHGPMEKKFFCEKCGSGFKRKGHFNSHMRKHEDQEKEDESFDCKICGVKLKHSHSLRIHMRWKHPADNKGKYYCEVCDKKFKNSDRLSRHNNSKHSNEKEPIFNKSQLKETIPSGTKAPREEGHLNVEPSGSSVCELQPSNAGVIQPVVSAAPFLHPIPFPMHHVANASMPYPPLNYNMVDNSSSQYFHI